MRQLKDHSGLSLAALARKTYVSRSAWQRYLNGAALPPRQAVESLARVTGTEPEPLLALWEVAAARLPASQLPPPGADGVPGGEYGEGVGDEGAFAPAPPPDAPRGGRRRWALLAPALVVAVAVAAATLLFLQPWDSGDEDTAGAGPTASSQPGEPSDPTPVASGASPSTYPCENLRGEGRLYSGNSTTMTELLGIQSAGPAVAEVQCLLLRHGIDPGPVDGLFGSLTEAAVIEFQREAGLTADGIVGPMTWEALRDG
ncbi:peptidoglycan-binding protein [Streptomyces sp. 4N509B]|uniref:peptidoglycan-binding protein n=1 Tax=Streptomyces sp. 4N509B TaxID=3457413 RepID=UPI003FD09BCC